MATTFILGPSGSTINLLDTSKHAILADGLNFRPSRQRTIIPVSGRDAVRLAYSQATQLEIIATVDVTGATHDVFATNWREILDQLRKARLFSLDGVGSQVEFTYAWENATASVIADVLDGEFPPVPEITHPWVNKRVDAQLLLICQPYFRAAAASAPASGTLTNDATWTPAAVGGDAPTPARLRIQNKQAAVNMNFIRAATRSRGTPANFLFPILPGANAPVGFSVTPQGASSSVLDVQMRGRASVPGGGTATWQYGFRSGGTWFTMDDFSITGAAWQDSNGIGRTVDIRTTPLGWLPADINSYEWGVRKTGTTQVDITQVFVRVRWLDRDLTVQTTDLLVTANGALTDWTATGVAEADEWDAVNDPVGAPDDATTFISSATDLQISVYVTQDLSSVDRGYNLRQSPDEAVRITINSNLSDHYGAFRVMVRAQGTATQELQLRWGGATGSLIANTAVALTQTNSTIEILDLGRMNIPEQEAPSDVSLASFVFSIWRGTGTSVLRIDAIELWPAENYVEFEPTTGPAENEFAVIDSLARIPTAFLANSAGARIQTLTHIGTPPVLDVGATRVLFRGSRSRSDDRRADSIAADLRYFQRYELQRGAG